MQHGGVALGLRLVPRQHRAHVGIHRVELGLGYPGRATAVGRVAIIGEQTLDPGRQRRIIGIHQLGRHDPVAIGQIGWEQLRRIDDVRHGQRFTVGATRTRQKRQAWARVAPVAVGVDMEAPRGMEPP